MLSKLPPASVPPTFFSRSGLPPMVDGDPTDDVVATDVSAAVDFGVFSA